MPIDKQCTQQGVAAWGCSHSKMMTFGEFHMVLGETLTALRWARLQLWQTKRSWVAVTQSGHMNSYRCVQLPVMGINQRTKSRVSIVAGYHGLADSTSQ